MTRKFFLILILGLAIRLILAPISSWAPDVSVWYQTINDIFSGNGVYDLLHFSYPPLWAYIFTPFLKLAAHFLGPAFFGAEARILSISTKTFYDSVLITSPIFNLFFKTPLIIADTAVGFLIYDLVKKYKTKRALLAFGLWFLNPLVIFVTTIQGQFDVFTVLFVLLSFWAMLEKKFVISGSALALATLFKFYPIVLFPLYFTFAILLNRDLKEKILGGSKFALGAILTFLLVLIPLIHSNIWTAVFRRTETINLGGGLNMHFFVFIPGAIKYLQFSPLLIIIKIFFWLGIFLLILIPLYLLLKKKINFQIMLTAQIVIILITLALILPLTNPQYLIILLPFLILLLLIEKIWEYGYWLLSFFGFFYYLALIMFSWRTLFYPLACFSHLLDIRKAHHQIVHFLKIPGFWNHDLSHDLLLIISFLAFLTMIFFIIHGFKRMVKSYEINY
jgi:Gpi18-like mannosyltransferase